MVHRADKFNLSETQDRRVKLTSTQKEEIVYKYNVVGNYSQRSLALEYGVSRRTIQFILNPDKLVENKKRREERGGSKIYYNKEKHTEAVRNLREYKRELEESGVKLNPNNIKTVIRDFFIKNHGYKGNYLFSKDIGKIKIVVGYIINENVKIIIKQKRYRTTLDVVELVYDNDIDFNVIGTVINNIEDKIKKEF